MSITKTHKSTKISTHAKKRYGQHQKHTKRFKDAYWPYLPLIIVVGLGLVVNSVWSHGSRGVLGYSTNMSVSTLLSDTNSERSASHESGLSLNNDLTAAAQAKANDMASRNYWSHDTPEGSPPWMFITNSGYKYQSAGENLAYGFSDADETITGWMNSADHRANILDKNYSNIGFGIANAENYQNSGPQTIVVAMYGQPVATTSSSKAANSPTFNESDIRQLKAQRVSRIQLLTGGNAPWSLFAVSALTSVAILWLVLRHGFLWRRAISSGEAFIVHHKLVDIFVVIVATGGYVLTRTSGLIH